MPSIIDWHWGDSTTYFLPTVMVSHSLIVIYMQLADMQPNTSHLSQSCTPLYVVKSLFLLLAALKLYITHMPKIFHMPSFTD